MAEKKICIIDDDAICTVILKKNIALIDDTLPVMTYSDGKEAAVALQEALNEGKPLHCIIFLDINMPVMDGWEFLDLFEKLTGEIGTDISVYLVSSSVSEEDKKMAAAYNHVKGYIIKPVKKEAIQEVLGLP